LKRRRDCSEELELESTVEKRRIKKVDLIVCAGLVAILAISIWFYIDLQRRKSINRDLQDQIYDLKYQLNLLNTTYLNYVSTHNHSNSEYDTYVADHQYTNSEYENYVAEHQYTNSEYDTYAANHQYTNSEYWNYASSHSYTNLEYEEAKFYFYYVEPKEQKYGVYGLGAELSGLGWIEPYQESVFDCSEMSACLEWYLENKGWNVIIVVGDAPSGGGYHAWLLVEASQGAYMPVEATTIEVVWWSDPYFDDYFTYDDSFETIQEALDY